MNDVRHPEHMTPGEKLVGLDFNPGGAQEVNRAKQDIAGLLDLLDAKFNEKSTNNTLTSQDAELYSWARKDLLSGQMMAVKFLTNKY